MILKIQRPHFPSDGPWLVYGEGRKPMFVVMEPSPEMRELMGDRSKVYVEADAIDEGERAGFELRHAVKDQSW